MTGPARGHRSHPHTADVILEAWGPDFGTCCEEAAAALVGVCVDGSSAVVIDRYRFAVPPAVRDSMLLDLLDEVLFVLDTEPAVPIRGVVDQGADGGLTVELGLADRRAVEVTGPAPKAVSRSGLTVDTGPGGARCSFLVDV